MDLSVVIPARNEMFLQKTIERVFHNAQADTEVIAVLDGYWPDPPIADRPNLTIVPYPESIGQRGATNVGVRLSQAKYSIKLDANCDLDMGFDVNLMEFYQLDCMLVPLKSNLHWFYLWLLLIRYLLHN